MVFALWANAMAGSTAGMARGDVSDEEWALIEPYLPLGERGPVPGLRRQFNGVVWRFRAGVAWRDVPVEYGPWPTVYGRFRAWAVRGVMQNLMEQMIAEAAARGEVDVSLVGVDSTTARAHHDAAGMRMDPGLLDALEKAADAEKRAAAGNKYGRTTTKASAMTQAATASADAVGG